MSFTTGATKTYLKRLEVEETVDFNSGNSYIVRWNLAAEEPGSDIFLGFRYEIQPDSDDTMVEDPNSDIMFGVAYSPNTNSVELMEGSYSGVPHTGQFVHVTIYAAWLTAI